MPLKILTLMAYFPIFLMTISAMKCKLTDTNNESENFLF